jgi:hypothetical protein
MPAAETQIGSDANPVSVEVDLREGDSLCLEIFNDVQNAVNREWRQGRFSTTGK